MWLAGLAQSRYADRAMTTPFHPPVKRSVEIAGHKTSISLEPLFWELLKQAAAAEDVPINALVAQIDAERIRAEVPPGLAGAVRIWLVGWLARRLP
jgi:predicted DNA-binding ribbon-helix-helix protein